MSDRNDEEWGAAQSSPGILSSLADALRRMGYDIEPPRAGDPRGGEIVARREIGDRVILCVVDGSGRFRVEISWLVGEWPSRQEIAGISLRAVDRVSRSVNLAGQADDPEHVAAMVAGLDVIVPWAGSAGIDQAPPTPR